MPIIVVATKIGRLVRTSATMNITKFWKNNSQVKNSETVYFSCAGNSINFSITIKLCFG
jgi:hypothetical protein